MFFENETFVVNVIDVLSMQYNKNRCETSKRSFDALSYRKYADTFFEYNKKHTVVSEKSITYVPSNLDYTRTTQSESMVVIHFKLYDKAFSDIEAFYPKNYKQYANYFDEILRIWECKEYGYQIKCNEYLNRILYLISTENSHIALKSMEERAALIIKKNYSNADFSVSDIASDFKISGAYLRRIFKNKFGVTLKEYLTKIRIEQARMLIDSRYFTIKEISKRCGFVNEKYFSTIFKKYMGVSPSGYK